MATFDTPQRKSIILKLPSVVSTTADTCKFLENHSVLVPAQLNEPNGEKVTYSVSLSGMYRGINQYMVNALSDVYEKIEKTAIEDCDIII